MSPKPTIWTAAASTTPILSCLDLSRPPSGKRAAKARAKRTQKRIEKYLRAFR